MANWSDLKSAVASIIKTNGAQQITGQLLQNVLNNIISNVGLNSTFAGIATPETNPGTPDGNVFYLATTAGTYSNFNGIVINSGEAVILEWKGSWVKKDSGFATKEQLSELGSKVSEGNRVFISNEDIKPHYIANDGFTIFKDNDNRCYCESFFGVINNGILVFDNPNNYQICILYYDRMKNVISYNDWFSVRNYVRIPNGAAFIRIAFGINYNSFEPLNFVCYKSNSKPILKPAEWNTSYKIPNINTTGEVVTLDFSALTSVLIDRQEFVFNEDFSIQVGEDNESSLRYLVFDNESNTLKFVSYQNNINIKYSVLGVAVSKKEEFKGAWFDFDFTVDGKSKDDSLRQELNKYIYDNKCSIETLNAIINGTDVCCINGESWSDNGAINIRKDEYAQYWHRSELIPLFFFDNYLLNGFKLATGSVEGVFFFDKEKVFVKVGNLTGGANIPNNAYYVAFHNYKNTSDGSIRQPVTFERFGLYGVRDVLRNDGVTNNIEVNAIVGELYLSGIDNESEYGILSITKGDISLYGSVYKIGADGYTNEGIVAQFYSMDLTQRIFELTESNASGISGYITVNYDKLPQSTVNYYAKINKYKASSIEYNPSIKAEVLKRKVMHSLVPLEVWNGKVVLIEDGSFKDVSSRWYVSKFDVRKVSEIEVIGMYDDNLAAAAAFFTENGEYIKEGSVAGNRTTTPTKYKAKVPLNAAYVYSSSTNNAKPIVSSDNVLAGSEQVVDAIQDNLSSINSLQNNTLRTEVYPTSPCVYMHHLFIDKIYSDSEVTIPCQSVFDVYVASKLGFQMIELNVLITSDGVPVTGHQVGTGILQSLANLNGEAVEVNVTNTTFDELRSNYRYKSIYPQYRVPISSLEECLYECRKFNIIPYVQCVNKDVVALVERVMGKRYVAYIYSGGRKTTDVTISEYRGGSIDDIVARCKEIGTPYIHAVDTTLNNMTDDEIKELVARVHGVGCWVGWAASYHSESQNQRLKGLGLDFAGSGWNVPDFDYGDEGYVIGNSIKGFSDFGEGFTYEDGVAKLSKGQSLSKYFEKKSILSKGSLHIHFKGELGITFGKIDEPISSDGSKEMVFTTIIENAEPSLYLYAYGDVEIYNVSYKVSNVI